MDVMKDPVIAMDGHTYERTAIENWSLPAQLARARPHADRAAEGPHASAYARRFKIHARRFKIHARTSMHAASGPTAPRPRAEPIVT